MGDVMGGDNALSTTSSGDTLDSKLLIGIDFGYHKDPTVLVAPNERVQKQWQKEYPGIKVVLSAKMYPLPKDFK